MFIVPGPSSWAESNMVDKLSKSHWSSEKTHNPKAMPKPTGPWFNIIIANYYVDDTVIKMHCLKTSEA